MNEIVPDTPFKFICAICDIKTNNKKDYTKHCLTAKHLNRTKKEPNSPKLPFSCKTCNKTYKARNSLWYHEQKCDLPINKKIYISDPEANVIDKVAHLADMVCELIKSNTNLQKQMLEVCKNTSISNSTVNSHNKTFNLQVFLNEKCKDAMNIKDFVNSMTLEFSDLEEVGKLGYVEGISNIVIRNLNAMDIYKRPIHCSDGKREIMYVKDDNVWEKESNTNDRLRRAIKQVTYKNSSMLVPWSQKYPNCMNNQHHLNDVYVKMMGQAMGGKEEFVDSENKIIKKIAKAVLIDKTC
jgi:hypothetical protein